MLPSLTADDAALTKLAARLVRCAAADAQRRYVVGIAGIGGSGKSTLAGRLLNATEAIGPGIARMVPMDGFHLTSAQLDALNLRERKGSPETFDAKGYVALIEAVGDASRCVRFPIYDRMVHEPQWGETSVQTVDATTQLIITEGNYLLLDQPPWSRLEHLLDECWWLEVAAEVARQRLIQRHIRGGRDAAAALAHYEHSDRPNMQIILTRRRVADLTLRGS